MKKLVNGVLQDQTQEEIKELEDLRAEAKVHEDQVDQEIADRKTKKASGKQKLKDLGLDDDEIQALLGV
tara:strand:- start:589 stop:795 length:207 start_codon:yes stop_codon:yes gene_type:complete